MNCNCYSRPIRHRLPDGKLYCPGCGKVDHSASSIFQDRQAEGWDGGLLAKLIGPCSPVAVKCVCVCHTVIGAELVYVERFCPVCPCAPPPCPKCGRPWSCHCKW